MRSFSAALGALFVAGLSLAAGAVHAQGAIKIGEINSYKAQPAFLGPYKKGMELAVAEVNSAGGIQGRKLELVGQLNAALQALLLSGLRQRHPQATSEELRRLLADLVLGPELAACVYGPRPEELRDAS